MEDNPIQDELVHLLSMFEVSFTARQRKNYLFYTLSYLMGQEHIDLVGYRDFLRNLAQKYFRDIYLDKGKLNAINTPIPGSFDESIIVNKRIVVDCCKDRCASDFEYVFGNGENASAGIPLFVFNYLDYKLWIKYADSVRGKDLKEENAERRAFFEQLGCKDFGLKAFDQFYFSRTRRSLEHYYPQANINKEESSPNVNQINCFGNYAMIGSEANSAGSNWDPPTKISHYIGDASGKINKIGVASLKFRIMMRVCEEYGHWYFNEISEHQQKMVKILMEETMV